MKKRNFFPFTISPGNWHLFGLIFLSPEIHNPQYGVEFPALQTRIFQWMAFRYTISGELYWAATYSFNDDPWESLWMSKYYGNR